MTKSEAFVVIIANRGNVVANLDKQCVAGMRVLGDRNSYAFVSRNFPREFPALGHLHASHVRTHSPASLGIMFSTIFLPPAGNTRRG